MKNEELKAAISEIEPTEEELERRATRTGPKIEAGISQVELADRLGLHPRTIANWISGQQPVNGAAAILIKQWAGSMKA